jgi:hypothetical protein
MKIKYFVFVILCFYCLSESILGTEIKYQLMINEISKDFWHGEPPFEAYVVNTTTNDTLFKNKRLSYVLNSVYHLYENHLYHLEIVLHDLGISKNSLYLHKYNLNKDGSQLKEMINIYEPNTNNSFSNIIDIGAYFSFDKLIVFLEVKRVGLDNEGNLFETYWQKIEVDLSTLETKESELIMVKDRHKMSID